MSIEVSSSKSNSDIELLLSDLDIDYRVVGSRSNSNSVKNVAAIDEELPQMTLHFAHPMTKKV